MITYRVRQYNGDIPFALPSDRWTHDKCGATSAVKRGLSRRMPYPGGRYTNLLIIVIRLPSRPRVQKLCGALRKQNSLSVIGKEYHLCKSGARTTVARPTAGGTNRPHCRSCKDVTGAAFPAVDIRRLIEKGIASTQT